MTHHLTESLLVAYAAGTLPEAYALVVASHLSLCDECRAVAEAWDAVGGEVLEAAEPAPLAADALERTLDLIELPARAAAPAARAGAFPAPLARAAGGGPDAVRWRRIGGGAAQAVLPTAEGGTARLLRIPAGAALPCHGHRGIELTMVVQGAFTNEGGRFARGDVDIADETVEHTPVVEPGEDCICLAATDAPLRFTALLPRLAQRFVGI